MKKILYGVVAISTLVAAGTALADPVEVGEAAGAQANYVSAGSSTTASASPVSSAVGVALSGAGGGDGTNTGTTTTTTTSTTPAK